MTLLLVLGILGLAIGLTPILTRVLGRNAGWPLAALYLATAGVFIDPTMQALAGTPTTWQTPWVPSLGINFAMRADGLSVVFGFIALVIGAVVFAYSTRYLEKGRQLSFYLVMTTFTFSMLALVMASDLMVLFIAWELTSLASFLLIARSGVSGEAASMRTLLMTFIGGLFLLSAVAFIWARTGTTDLQAIFAHHIWTTDPAFTTGVAALVAIAAFTKSAQFPFHIWLPDAMAAITPVSAYLHAAAVVKAGIFLLLRFSPLFHDTPVWNALLLTAGLFTTCLGGWFALQQSDLKRLMAYSTVSQLGLIVATIGVGTETALIAATIHTIAHALFKSGLFMMVGVVDHSVHTRDLRRMPPKMYKDMPVSFTVMVLGCASMAGIPPMMGFISKESILTALLGAPGASWAGWAAFLVAALGAVITFSYCAKIVWGTFIDGTDTTHPVGHRDSVLLTFAGLPIVASIPLAFTIASLDDVVSIAAGAASGAEAHAHLAMFHGFTVELLATAIIIAIGVLIVWKRRPVFKWAESNVLPYTGADVIAAIARGLRRAGAWLAGLVDSYAASRHVLAILGTLAAISFGGVLTLVGAGLPAQMSGLTQPIDLVLLVLIAMAVWSVCRSKSRIAATVSLSAVGILATVQILVLGAPDVALTQLLVESLSIIVIMLVLQKLPVEFPKMTGHRNRTAIAISVIVGAAVAGLTWALNGRRGRSDVAQYYLDNTKPLTSGDNVVNVILVEFRALDTMGELAVLGMAGVAILAVLSSVRHRHLDPEGVEKRQVPTPELALRSDPGSTAWRAIHVSWPNVVPLQLMLRFINPVLILISLMLFYRGHNEPGGGFIAALVASAVVGLVYLSTSTDRQIGLPRVPLALIGGGVITAVGTGLAGLVIGGSFLEPLHGYIGSVHVSTSMIFDVGVYTAVVGLIMVAFNVLGTANESDEATRERVDESVVGELDGPLDTVRGDQRVAATTRFLSEGEPPKELGR